MNFSQKITGFGLLLLTTVCGWAITPVKPNIVLVMAEDISTDLACYGMKAVKTPVLDKMAQEGIRFTNCFGNNSICSPSRSTLMSLGVAGVGGLGNRIFNAPTDVLVAPDGSIFVADGHFGYGMEGKEPNNRIVKFAPDGTYMNEWGKTGTGPGEFIEIHALAMDADGRLFAADRRNRRIQIFDQEGTLLDIWTQFGMPSDIFIDGNNMLYCTDSESASPDEKEAYKGFPNTGWVKGIRIGSAGDGMVTAFIPDENIGVKGSTGGEGVAADSEGNVYTVGVKPMGIRKYERKNEKFK